MTAGGEAWLTRARPRRLAPAHIALAAILALSAVLNTHRLSQNGYANIFYSAGARSMLRSLHNFLYASFDPGGLATIDKPPLGVWAQVASAKLFGFSPLSLLLPEAIAGVLAVAVLYLIVERRLGVVAGLASALALAVSPSFVAVSRDNGVDPLLILLMVLACGAGLRATQTGRMRSLLACAVLVGLAFNTKTLAAYLVVPPIGLAYLVCAPSSIGRRLTQMAAAGLAMLAVSFSWIALVELTPAAQRPFVGSSTDNTELNLTFKYNGFGRVNGQVGGPAQTPAGAGALVSRHVHATHGARTSQRLRAAPTAGKRRLSPVLPNGRNRNAIAFGGPPGPLRLFGAGLDDQAAWVLPLALAGLLALALQTLGAGREERGERLAVLLVLGGWFLTEAIVLSLSKGIVHPYYASALAPGAAAMTGAGVVAFAQFAQHRDWRLALVPCAVIATVAVQVVLLHREHYMQWFGPVLIAVSAVGVGAMAIRRLAGLGMALTLGVLLIAPAAYATTTWLAPVEGTFPAAGPAEAIGYGGFDVSSAGLQADRALLQYVGTHGPGARWAVLTDASDTAAPLILLGLDAGALGGYGGTDPILDGPGLAHLVARHEARYVVLGGAYSNRGGNRATAAVARACSAVPFSAWRGGAPSNRGLVLFDCAVRTRWAP
jgi:4-amino-4-deoxy-L-arabinose transferase-like glycosyltransferase